MSNVVFNIMFSSTCDDEIGNLYRSHYITPSDLERKRQEAKCLDLYNIYKEYMRSKFEQGELQIYQPNKDIKRVDLPSYQCAMNMFRDQSKGKVTTSLTYQNQDKYPTDVYLELYIKYTPDD